MTQKKKTRFVTPMLALVLAFVMLLAMARNRDGMEALAASSPVLVRNAPIDPATLLKTTETSQFNPPSPDPTGIVYLPDSHTLLISDSEVNEMAHLFTGDNLFQVTPGGELVDTLTVVSFSNEPTGVAHNPHNGFLYFSDDSGMRGFYEVNPGSDGMFGTADDVVRFVNTELFGARDVEGITFDSINGNIFLAHGTDGGYQGAIYKLEPGVNTIFDGAPPAGDDVVTVFDSLSLGIPNPEGIDFNPDNGNLYVISGSGDLIGEIEPDGTLVRYIGVSAIGAHNLADLAYGPASADPAGRSLYLVARGVDNETDPLENDGVLYEISFPLNVDNLPPFVDAGSDQVVELDEVVQLVGNVSDDGNPEPPAALVTSWSQIAGPGVAQIDDSSALQTTVSFSTYGAYTLRLTAGDGELEAWDEVTIVVRPEMLFLPVLASGADPGG